MTTVGHYAITFGRSATVAEDLRRHDEARLDDGPFLVVDNNPRPIQDDAIPPSAVHVDLCRNVGPAGAARIAVLLLAAKGCQVVTGGDDDMVGGDQAILARCYEALSSSPDDVVAVAAYGSFYSDRLARQRKPTVAELRRLRGEGTFLDVGAVGGGRPSVWRIGPLRNVGLQRPELFFGIEDFELGGRLRGAGYRMLVIPELMIPQLLQETVRIETGVVAGPLVVPWRRYYNSRNATYLACIDGRLIGAVLMLVARVGSVFLRGRIPWRLRLQLALVEAHGFADGVAHRMGKSIAPQGYT